MKKLLFFLSLSLLLLGVVFKVWNTDWHASLRIYCEEGAGNINTRPFKTLFMCFKALPSRWAVLNLVGNSAPFYLVSRLARLAFPDTGRGVLFSYLASAFTLCEAVQYVTCTGICDVDDVFMNTVFFALALF